MAVILTRRSPKTVTLVRNKPLAQPVLLSVSPASVTNAGAVSVTLAGYNLTGVNLVTVAGVFITPTSMTDTAVVFAVPVGLPLGTDAVTVSNPTYQSNTVTISVIASVAPTVTSFSASSGPFRSLSRSVTGTGFVNGCTVNIGILSCPTVTFNSSTSLTVSTPVETANGGPYDIVVTNPDRQTGTLPAAYRVQCDLFDFAGLRADFAADLGITQSAGSVSSWADQSGIGNTVTQAGANKPTVVASALNGLPIVRGDGTSQNMSRSSFSMGAGGEMFVSMVLKDRTGVFLGGIILQSGAVNITNLATLSGGIYSAVNGTNTAQGGTIATTFHRVSWVERSNGTQQLWINGTSIATTSVAYNAVDATGIFTMFGDGGAQNFGGIDVAEIAIYNVDHTADRSNIESYLTSKWGV